MVFSMDHFLGYVVAGHQNGILIYLEERYYPLLQNNTH